MNTCHICDRTSLNGPKPHSIRMPRTAFNEKLAYVESVLDVMLESRFGPGYSYSYLERPDDNAADEPVSFLDKIDEEFAPRYCQNRLRKRVANTRLSLNAAESLDGRPNVGHPLGFAPALRCFPPTLGRGSPTS